MGEAIPLPPPAVPIVNIWKEWWDVGMEIFM